MIKFMVPKVFDIYPTEEHELILPIDDKDFERATFDGQSAATNWIPIHVKRVKDEVRKRKMLPGDFPGGGLGDLAMSKKAKETIGPFLKQYGELLPLACDDGEFWTLNVTCIIDALDETKSVLHRSKQDGSILIIAKYAFRPEALENAVIFRIPQYARGSIFVTTPFVELIKSTDLTGIVFKQIWAPN